MIKRRTFHHERSETIASILAKEDVDHQRSDRFLRNGERDPSRHLRFCIQRSITVCSNTNTCQVDAQQQRLALLHVPVDKNHAQPIWRAVHLWLSVGTERTDRLACMQLQKLSESMPPCSAIHLSRWHSGIRRRLSTSCARADQFSYSFVFVPLASMRRLHIAVSYLLLTNLLHSISGWLLGFLSSALLSVHPRQMRSSKKGNNARA
uniref:Uncharacterized protein n=1 Tax=Trichuris muris TaxID=70415 RepID=A0A5S6QDE8_TRIMR